MLCCVHHWNPTSLLAIAAGRALPQLAEEEEFTAKQKELEEAASPVFAKMYQGAGGGGGAGAGGMPGGELLLAGMRGWLAAPSLLPPLCTHARRTSHCLGQEATCMHACLPAPTTEAPPLTHTLYRLLRCLQACPTWVLALAHREAGPPLRR